MLHQHPFLRICVAFVVGIVIAYVYPCPWLAGILFASALAISLLQLIPSFHYHDHLAGMSLFLCIVAMGMLTLITYPKPAVATQQPTYPTPPNLVTQTAEQTQQHLLDILAAHTDSIAYGYTSAMVLGKKTAISKRTKQHFSAAGASHLLAVSGLHVGIIYGSLCLLLFPFSPHSRTRKIASIVIIVLLWGYAYLCGLPASIIRAVTMFSISAIGMALGQKIQSLNTVFCTAFIMLLYNPYYLFEIGFQLSFGAVIGIILLYPKLYQSLSCKHTLTGWLWGMLCVSTAAQIGTLPFILYYFGSFPLYFLLTNALLIPLSTLLIYCTLALFLLSPLEISHLMDYPIHWICQLLHGFSTSISQLPFAKIHVSIGLLQAYSLTGLLLATCIFIYHPRVKHLYLPLCCIILILLSGITSDIYKLFVNL